MYTVRNSIHCCLIATWRKEQVYTWQLFKMPHNKKNYSAHYFITGNTLWYNSRRGRQRNIKNHIPVFGICLLAHVSIFLGCQEITQEYVTLYGVHYIQNFSIYAGQYKQQKQKPLWHFLLIPQFLFTKLKISWISWFHCSHWCFLFGR
jgi:hypothetical protein